MTTVADRVTRAQVRAEARILLDRCTIWRDPEGSRDDTFDPVTLSYGGTGDATAAAVGVACKVRASQLRPTYGEQGAPTVITEYTVSLSAAVDVRAGDLLEITASTADRALAGEWLVVVEPSTSSTVVLRHVRAMLRQPGVDLP